MRDAVATITRSVPLLGGFFTIVASENRTNCYSHSEDGQTDCPRCRQRRRADVLAEVNALIREGASSINPAVKTIAWDWGMYEELPAAFVDALPTDVDVMGVSEQVVEKIVGGIKTKMIMNGAVNAVMSGSGPTVFGIFDDFEKAKKSADSFAYQFKDVFLTQVLN